MKDEVYLTPEELAERWKVTTGQLAILRFRGQGPEFLKLGKKGGTGTVRYLLSSVEAYEEQQKSRITGE